jgi:hypothetical protein
MVLKTSPKMNDTPVFGNLNLACEWSETEWQQGFTIGPGRAPREIEQPRTRLDFVCTWDPVSF